MECKYLDHGLAFGYSNVVKPCCYFVTDNNWNKNNNLNSVDLKSWHNSTDVNLLKEELLNEKFPVNCTICKNIEKQNIKNSPRQDSFITYKNFNHDDITIEIRPGVTCNFSCQTCWPNASSRVKKDYKKANIEIRNESVHKITNFDYLAQIKDRIKNVIVLGGEPFYDKNCKKFFEFAEKNLNADLHIFTNGSLVDFNFIKNYNGKIIIIFSLDAIDKSSEYIRFGSNWNIILKNYLETKKLTNVETRINITVSVYNVCYINNLLEFLLNSPPNVINFGYVNEEHFDIKVIPKEYRNTIIEKINFSIKKVILSKIEKNQQIHIVNNLKYIINKLLNDEWDKINFEKWQNFVKTMDKVKNIDIRDYSDFLHQLLNYQSN